MSAGCTSCSLCPTNPSPLRIAVLGVCGSGKSTLARALGERGYEARQISQEHSGVRRLWQRIFMPDLLVYLDASAETVQRRLHTMPYGDIYGRQLARLELARCEADIVVDTDPLSAEQVLEAVLSALPQRTGS